MPVYLLNEHVIFPDARLANQDGLLAVGGDLSLDRLLLAYRSGIFPWYSAGEPLMWWSPPERMVLFPEDLKIHKSMRPVLNQGKFRVTYNQDFAAVIRNCAKINRPCQPGTWITPDMQQAYMKMHEKGYAHSVEVWQGNELVGGLYGVMIGSIFCGESMFAKASNASKVGFITLVQHLQKQGFKLIDCQIYTDHLASLGAAEIEREDFLELLDKWGGEEVGITFPASA